MSMYAIGLTGGIGSGKTVVSDHLAALGAGVIDSDVMARRVTATGGTAIAAIAAAFGDDFISDDGAMDRVRMRELIFNDPQARTTLESITHPLIRAEITQERTSPRMMSCPYLVFAVPLLIESGQHLPQTHQTHQTGQKRFDRILVVDCAEETQIARVMARSALSRAQACAIIAAQATRAARLAAADDVVVNENLSLAQLFEQVDALHRRYLLNAANAQTRP